MFVVAAAFPSTTCSQEGRVTFVWRGEAVVRNNGGEPNPLVGPWSGSGSASNPEHLHGRITIIQNPSGEVGIQDVTFGTPRGGDSLDFEVDAPFLTPQDAQRSIDLGGIGVRLDKVFFRMKDAVFTGGTIDAATIDIFNRSIVNVQSGSDQMTFRSVEFKADELKIIAGELFSESDRDVDVTLDGGKTEVLRLMQIGGSRGAPGNTNSDLYAKINVHGTELNSEVLLVTGFPRLNLENVTGVVKQDVRFGDRDDDEIELRIGGDNTDIVWARDGGATQFGVLGDAQVEIARNARVNLNDTIVGFFPSAKAELDVRTGAQLKSRNAIIGLQTEDHVARATLSDNSRWDIAGFLEVGREGLAKLEVMDDSIVNVKGLVVMSTEEDADSEMIVASGEMFRTEATFEVGRSGKAELTIKGGGRVVSEGDAFVGTNQKGDGKVTITGMDSQFVTKGNFNLGNGNASGPSGGQNGKGVLILEKGGRLEIADGKDLRIGRREGAQGELIIKDENSSVVGGENKNGKIFTGYDGNGKVTVQNDGRIDLEEGELVLGKLQGSTGEFTMDGSAGALVSVKVGEMIVGDEGFGKATVEGGGILSVKRGLTVGNQGGSSVTDVASQFTISGPGSELAVDGDIVVGKEGKGMFVVSGGTSISLLDEQNGDLIAGEMKDGQGEVLITGENSKLTIKRVVIGEKGQGIGTLSLQGQLHVTENMTVGDQESDETSEFTVRGNGGNAAARSTLRVDGVLTVGDAGKGKLTVDDGRLEIAADKSVLLGAQEDAEGELEFRGELASLGGGFNAPSPIKAGIAGKGTITLKEKASLDFHDRGLKLGEESTGEGILNVSGEGTSFKMERLTVGDKGSGTVLIEEKGVVELAENLTVGFENKERLSEVTLKGEGSMLKLKNGAIIGHQGKGQLTVEDGGALEFDAENDMVEIVLGNMMRSEGTLELRGDKTSTTIGSELTIGREGKGTLKVSEGAKVNYEKTKTIVLGVLDGSEGEIQVVGTGAASGNTTEFRHAGRVHVGQLTEGKITIEDGGIMKSGVPLTPDSVTVVGGGVEGVLGTNADDGNGEVIVKGQGSRWEIGGDLYVGAGKGTGKVTVEDGGNIVVPDEKTLFIVNGDAGATGELLIAGEGSEVTYKSLRGASDHAGSRGEVKITIEDRGKLTSSSGGNVALGVETSFSLSTLTHGIVQAEIKDRGQWHHKGSFVLGGNAGSSFTVRDDGLLKVEGIESMEVLGTIGSASTILKVLGGGRVEVGVLELSLGNDDSQTMLIQGDERNEASLKVKSLFIEKNAGLTLDTSARVEFEGGGEISLEGTRELLPQLRIRNAGARFNAVGQDVELTNGKIDIASGGHMTAQKITVQGDRSLDAGLAVHGASSRLVAKEIAVGESSDGQLRVFDQGRLETDFLTVAKSVSGLGDGTVIVETNGTLQVNVLADVSDRGTGSIHINGGTMTAPTVHLKSNNPGNDHPGQLRVSGSQGKLRVNSVTVGDAIGTAVLGSDAGGLVEIVSSLHVGEKGEVRTGGGFVTVGGAAGRLGAVNVDGGGALSGSGTIFGHLFVRGESRDEFGNGGKVIPGNSPGTLNVTGDFVLGDGGIIDLEIAGSTAGMFDVIEVGGQATLEPGSIINLLFTEGFAPTQGDTFSFVSAAGGINVAPETLQFSVIGLKPGFEFMPMLTSNGFAITAINDGAAVHEPATGDFNANGLLDVGDIDLLTNAISRNSADTSFDLNDDARVDLDDHRQWVEVLRTTYYGDSNLDGEFNSADLVAVFVAGKYEQDLAASWNEGDWDGNGRFASSDLVAAFADGGYEQGPRSITAVPEPNGAFLVVWALVAVGRRRRIGRQGSVVPKPTTMASPPTTFGEASADAFVQARSSSSQQACLYELAP